MQHHKPRKADTGSADTYLRRIEHWLHKPFKENGSAMDWFLFLGFTGVIAYFWTQVIKRIGQ